MKQSRSCIPARSAQAFFASSGFCVAGVMTAVQQLMQMPQGFVELCREACPQVFEAGFHTLDNEARYLDLMEMYSGSGRLAALCSKVARL